MMADLDNDALLERTVAAWDRWGQMPVTGRMGVAAVAEWQNAEVAFFVALLSSVDRGVSVAVLAERLDVPPALIEHWLGMAAHDLG